MNIFLLVLAFYLLFMTIIMKPNNTLSCFIATLPTLLAAVTLCALGLKGLGILTF